MKKETKAKETKTKRTVRALTEKERNFLNEILEENKVMSDATIAHIMHDNNIATDLSMKDLRNKIRYARLEFDPEEKTRVMEHKDGSITVIEHNIDRKNPEKFLDATLVEEVGLNESKYQLSSYAESEWENNNGDTLHSCRKKFSLIRDNEVSLVDLEKKYFRDRLVKRANSTDDEERIANQNAEFYNSIPVSCNNKAKYSLIIPLADLHIGEANPKKMVESYKNTIVNSIFPAIAEYCDDDKVRSIDIACLGDLIHCDNKMGTTTAGTNLELKSDFHMAYIATCEFIEWLIATVRNTFNIPVRVVYVYGNHDTNMGFAIMHTIKTLFSKVNGVEFMVNEAAFDCVDEDDDDWYMHFEGNPEYMWVPYDNVGITYTHGKYNAKNGKNIPELANPNARKDVNYNAVIFGHRHHLNEAYGEVNQHNYGISTPNFVRDKFAKSLGCVTDAAFYLFKVNHQTERVSYEQFPSLPIRTRK